MIQYRGRPANEISCCRYGTKLSHSLQDLWKLRTAGAGSVTDTITLQNTGTIVLASLTNHVVL